MAILLGVLCLAGATRAEGSGAGLDLIHNDTARLAQEAVPGSVDSTVVRERQFAFWHREWGEEERLDVDLEHEDYTLRAGDGAALIDLSLVKVHPRLRMTRERWALDGALLALSSARRPGVYTREPRDDAERFLLPALVLDATPRPLLMRLGYWEEYEVLPLQLAAYAISVARVFVLGGGYQFTQDAVARLEVRRSRRFYPSAFTLERSDAVGEFRLRDPLGAGEGALWREASVELTRQHYPVSGAAFTQLALASVLRFGLGRSTHFLKPQLKLANSYVVYVPDSRPETLLEETVRQPDALASVAYEGFTRPADGPIIVAWGATAESSLSRRVQRTIIVHVKAEYTY